MAFDEEYFKYTLAAHAEHFATLNDVPWPRIDITLANGVSFWVNSITEITPDHATFRQMLDDNRVKDWTVPYGHVAYVTFDTSSGDTPSDKKFGFQLTTPPSGG